MVVEVVDVQDTAPFFLAAPPVTRLKETAKEVENEIQKGFLKTSFHFRCLASSLFLIFLEFVLVIISKVILSQ